MRLPSLIRGDRFAHRAFIRLTRLLGADADDVVKVIFHRPAFFGGPFIAFAREAMRGPSAWSAGERELFGSVVSSANECAFCVGTHEVITENLLGAGALRNWEDGGHGPRATATCRFLQKLTREPDAIDRADVRLVLDAGVEPCALLEAVYVAVLFNLINRIANALDFGYRSDSVRIRGAAMLHRMGYTVPGFLMR